MNEKNPFTRTGWDGDYILVNSANQPIQLGDQVQDFRGGLSIVQGGSAPHKPSSNGKVCTSQGECYPTVYALKWVKVNDQISV